MNSESEFWRDHEWWAVRGDAEVSLAMLIDKFVRTTAAKDRPGATPTMYRREMQSWTRLLGQEPWVRDQIGPNAALLATQGVRNVYRNSAAWDAISQLLGNKALPLARYSLSFYNEVYDRRPAVRREHATYVREHARSVPKDVRAALVDAARPTGSVLSTEADLDAFGYAPDRDGDRVVAMRSFAKHLLTYATAADDDELTFAVDQAVSEMAEEFDFSVDEVAATIRRATPQQTATARSAVFATLLTMPDAHERDDYIKLVERSIQKVTRRLVVGDPIPDADFIVRQTVRDLDTELRRPTSLTETPLGHDEINLAATDARAGWYGHEAPQEHINQAMVLEAGRQFLAEVRIDAHWHPDGPQMGLTQFWEKAVAQTILDGHTTLGLIDRSTVRSVVIERWLQQSGRPENAVCTNRVQAAQLIEGLLQMAVAVALRNLEDFSDWVGRRDATQPWANRLAAVDAALAATREQSPQDLYDRLYLNGNIK
ncbi:hypothetical protein [Mycolicibacterium llatzerense]|uniref:hypothetical protein n=1 Tax=Mycolicibacterium llatzerense TaxID=280871 RepID=UPI0008DE5EA3|nr:hypothetical protein [Mycolicibacterium llatzerense]